MKILIIGGTGTISGAIVRLLAEQGHEVTVLNRGSQKPPEGVCQLTGDMNQEAGIQSLLQGRVFDAAADFIAFEPEQAERDFRLFAGRTGQFVFISSASAYQKDIFPITESTPLYNPRWEYSRKKIACEEALLRHYREDGFPVTIVRPSHTYSERNVPVALHGPHGSWQVVKRMMEGRPILLPGDGTTLWTLTHSRDFARAFAGLLGNPHAIGEAVQITSDEALTWNQISHVTAACLGKPLKAVHVSSDFLHAVSSYGLDGSLMGDKANCAVFDNTKLKRLVPGFQAQIRFDQGVRMSLEYLLSHPSLQKEDPEFDAWCDRVIAVREAAISQMHGEPS